METKKDVLERLVGRIKVFKTVPLAGMETTDHRCEKFDASQVFLKQFPLRGWKRTVHVIVMTRLRLVFKTVPLAGMETPTTWSPDLPGK